MPDYTTLPPIEEQPILEHLGKISKMTLAVSEIGHIYIFHETPLPEPANWVEFDPETSKMYLVYETGHIQDIGITVEPALSEKIQAQDIIFVVRLENGKEKEIYEMQLLIKL